MNIMKNKNLTSFVVFIIICLFILTGCNKKKGIGSHNLFETYYGSSLAKVERISPEFKPMTGDTDSDYILIDEKAGFTLILHIEKNYVDQVIVVYRKSSDNKKQAEIMLEPPNDATCHEIDGSLWDKGMMQFICYKRGK